MKAKQLTGLIASINDRLKDVAKKLGVGTDTPEHKLEVHGDMGIRKDDKMYFGKSDDDGYRMYYDQAAGTLKVERWVVDQWIVVHQFNS